MQENSSSRVTTPGPPTTPNASFAAAPGMNNDTEDWSKAIFAITNFCESLWPRARMNASHDAFQDYWQHLPGLINDVSIWLARLGVETLSRLFHA